MSAVPISIDGLSSQRKSLDGEVLIGKDVLELLTGAMYVDPLCIYREYIQNSTDAIDEGRQNGMFSEGTIPRIEISLNHSERSIRIRDNGPGIGKDHFLPLLTSIGGSHKRGSLARGFRGVGRLSGLGYCQELIFRTRSIEDSKVAELTWDGRKLKEVLRRAGGKEHLDGAIREIAHYTFLPDVDYPKHFFEVELRKVARVRNDLLLNEEEIRHYLSQIAPVPFAPDFKLGAKINEFLDQYGVNTTYEIGLSDGSGPIYRPHSDSFAVNRSSKDNFSDVKTFELKGIEGETTAVGWTLDHSYFGALTKGSGLSGFRLRSGNIQVGASGLISNVFKESRFNSWSVGELHIVSPKIVPNGRRDDFEPSIHYQHLLSGVTPLVHEISKKIRDKSTIRNRLKRAESILSSARDTLALLNKPNPPGFLIQFVRARVQGLCDELKKLVVSNKFKQEEIHLIGSQIGKLEQKLSKAATKTKGKSVLRGISSTQNAAYEHLLGVLYEVSPNVQEANKLSNRIIERLQRDVKAKARK